jgi:AcrR family transcriptional regulator
MQEVDHDESTRLPALRHRHAAQMLKAVHLPHPQVMERRERLLHAAREVLAESGLRAEIQVVLARSGVSAGAAYRIFPDKEALFLEVTREMANKTNAKLLEIVAKVRDARECVAQVMDVGFARVEEYGQLAIDVVAGNTPPAYRAVVNHMSLGFLFSLVIQRGIVQGHFRPDLDVEYVVEAWFALVAPQVLHLELSRRSVAEIAQLTTDFFLSAISVRSAGPDRSEN